MLAAGIGAGVVWGLDRYEAANPEPFAFGDGGVTTAEAIEILGETSQALIADEKLAEARGSGDPYYLVTRLAEWNTDGWYRLGLADQRAWGVAVTEEGNVVVARETQSLECVAYRVTFYAERTSEVGAEPELVALPTPVVEEGLGEVIPCDPSAERRFNWTKK